PAGQLVAGKAAIRRQDEVAAGEPASEHKHSLEQPLRRRLVAPAPPFVFLFGVTEDDEDGQSPQTRGPGNGNEDEDDEPLVPPAEGGVAVAGAHGVAVAAFAVDLVAGVLIDGVIGGQVNRAGGNEVIEDPAGEAAAQAEKGPAAAGEEAVLTGRIAR